MREKRVPHNTAREAKENPSAILGEALVFGSNGLVERQEAEGQQSFVESDTLPTDLRCSGDGDPKSVLEAAGVRFLGRVEGDPKFQLVQLPAGWKKVPTDHSMWSDLVDEKGRKRASIFYKAAFYDRAAHLLLSTRFSVEIDYARRDQDGMVVAHATDCGKAIYSTPPLSAGSESAWSVQEGARKRAEAWLDEQHPDWRNPGVYWD